MQEHTHVCVCVCVCVYTRTYPQRIDGHGDQAHPNRRNRGWRVPINRRAALYYVGAEVCVCVCARARAQTCETFILFSPTQVCETFYFHLVLICCFLQWF